MARIAAAWVAEAIFMVVFSSRLFAGVLVSSSLPSEWTLGAHGA